MQLQGEMMSKESTQRIYKNPIQALFVIGKNEGIRGLQNGLGCAYPYQVALNGSRLGLYEPIRTTLNSVFFPHLDANDHQNLMINITSGTVSGVTGAILGSPLFLVKTRLQSYSTAIKIGQQTKYDGMMDGLTKIYKKEGFKGWFRGVDAAILRTGSASSVQLPIYNAVKIYLLKHGYMEDGASLHLTASAFSGIGVSVICNPWDVILTRMYNQTGNLYKGPIDCFMKTVRTEGLSALYKGFVAQLLRMAPHTILCLTFMEQTSKWVLSGRQAVFGS